MTKTLLTSTLLLLTSAAPSFAVEATIKKDVRYSSEGHARQVLDIYSPPKANKLPVIFWIHGGGWQSGDKTNVQEKPKALLNHGFVFVSTSHRLLPEVAMEDVTRDVATALAWVHRNISKHGGDPERIIVGGHSSGAQLATLLCTDDRYLKTEGMAFTSLKGCIAVDGDTYDVPAIIETAETRRRVHGQPQPKSGHREKFGNDSEKHKNFSAVTHIAPGKNIPPFLILHVAEHPDNSAQAFRLSTALMSAGVPVQLFGARETNHTKINANLGTPNDPSTGELYHFLSTVIKK